MSGAVVGLAGAGAVYVAIRSGFRWAGRRCETALADAQLYSFTDDRLTVLLVKPGSHSLTRTEARDLAALQQAFDRRGGTAGSTRGRPSHHPVRP